MRQTISGLVAAVAAMTASAVPAMACGGGWCSPCGVGYASPCAQPQAYERLSDPAHQYYFVNQGPTYTGPGGFVVYPTYQDSAVSGWGAYQHRPYYYGYDGGRYADATTHYYDGAGIDGPAVYSYSAGPHFRPWHPHYGYRYGFVPRHMRYGGMMPYDYGHHGHVRRYY
jgi:hypothetical protein